jgi:hypothetical protein
MGAPGSSQKVIISSCPATHCNTPGVTISGARSDDLRPSPGYRPNVGPGLDAFPTWSVIPALFGTRSRPELDPAATWSVNLAFERVRHRPEPVRLGQLTRVIASG